MSDRINCRNCIHFNDLEHRCCLNDGSATQKECYFILSNRKPKGKDVVIEHLKTKITDLEAKLAESEKTIQAYEEIVEQKDEEISFANRDKTYIVKQLNDPNAYVLLEDYKQLKQQLAESEEYAEYNIPKLIEANKMMSKQLQERDRQIREMVCKTIREALCMTNENSICNTANCVYYDDLNAVLERIEKGENK